MVNLSFVKGFEADDLVLSEGSHLPISRRKKKEFIRFSALITLTHEREFAYFVLKMAAMAGELFCLRLHFHAVFPLSEARLDFRNRDHCSFGFALLRRLRLGVQRPFDQQRNNPRPLSASRWERSSSLASSSKRTSG
jgi:hypothetical protein